MSGETNWSSNLVKCRACQRDVSVNARACPNCGEPLRKEKPNRIGLLIAVWIAFFIFIGVLVYGHYQAESAAEQTRREADQIRESGDQLQRDMKMQLARMGVDSDKINKAFASPSATSHK
jgi:predicted amidophosphoribosyltransferase